MNKFAPLLIALALAACDSVQPPAPPTGGLYSENIVHYLFAPEGRSVVIDTTLTDWAILNDTAFNDFLITPGDYTHLGPIPLETTGTEKYRTLRWHNPAASDYEFNEGDPEVVVESYEITDNGGWLLYGLTFRGVGASRNGLVGGLPSKMLNADRVVVSTCTFENVLAGACVRAFNVTNTKFQYCLFQGGNFDVPGADLGGIQLTAYEGHASENVRIVHSVFRNLTDGIGLSRNRQGPGQPPQHLPTDQTGYNRNVLIAKNRFFYDRPFQPCTIQGQPVAECACAENFIDVKMGSDDPAKPVQIIENEFGVGGGLRPTDQTCGGTGDIGTALVLHQDARNVHIERNTITDVSAAMYAFKTDPKWPEAFIEGVRFVDNNCSKMVGTVEPGTRTGIFLRITTAGVLVEGNFFGLPYDDVAFMGPLADPLGVNKIEAQP